MLFHPGRLLIYSASGDYLAKVFCLAVKFFFFAASAEVFFFFPGLGPHGEARATFDL